jgi:hypothetical protein
MAELTDDHDTASSLAIGLNLEQPNNQNWSRVLCPITRYPCEGDHSYL